jgi:hypothetical protein
MSTRIPFGLFLKVGGNKENSAKLTVCPDAAAPSRVTVKLFAVEDAEAVGRRVTLTSVHSVLAAEIGTEAETSDFPVAVCRPTVTLPLNAEVVGNL